MTEAHERFRAPRKARLALLDTQTTNGLDGRYAAGDLRQACIEHFNYFVGSGFVAHDLTWFAQRFPKGEFKKFRLETAALIQSTYATGSSQGATDQVCLHSFRGGFKHCLTK